MSKLLLKMVEGSLLCTAATCFFYLASVAIRAQTANTATRQHQPSSTSILVNDDPPASSSTSVEVMGRLSIPRLKVSVPIMADYEARSLLRGVGHVPGSAMPGGLGTMGLAGHRDTYFRALRGIKRDMDIQIEDRTGTYHYSVDSTEVVTPDAVSVLDIQSRPELTLITCYPFNYIGAAPERFIVHAHLVSALPDE